MVIASIAQASAGKGVAKGRQENNLAYAAHGQQ